MLMLTSARPMNRSPSSPIPAAVPRKVGLMLLLALAGCGGSDSEGTTPPPPPTSFAGTYATTVTLAQNTCGAVTVQSLPTTVTFDATSRAVGLTHGGTTYTGTVAADSTFTTAARDVNVGDGFQYVVTVTGKFGARSFTADARVDRSGSGAACFYVAHWVGSR
jgi:hypothetical protein